jgi:hypothetical protein
MTENSELKPPYVSPGPADKFFDLLRRITPIKIDSKFVSDNGITTPPNAATIVKLAQWFGIINAAGEVNSNKVRMFKLSGEERNKQIADTIREAYKDLFERVHLESATKNDVLNYFVNTHQYGYRQAEIAALLFLHLCQSYDIPMAEGLKRKVHVRGSKKSPLSQTKKIKLPMKELDREKSTDSAASEFSTPREGSGVEIEIRCFGIEASPHTTIIARTKEELESKLKTEFSAFMEYVKILLMNVNAGHEGN